jgi:PAS domain S-box-containing protein
MVEPLRIVILEDNPADAELVQFELNEAGIIFISKVVMTEEDFVRGIQEFCPDLILSDYDLPKYNGALALAEARKRCPDTPFILVTGAITEDRAIEILTQGAKDYVLKTRLHQRLVPAVQRALAEAEEHRALKQAEAELRESHRTSEETVEIRTAELEAEKAAWKKTERALQQSEESYRAFFNNMQEGFYIAEIIYDGDGKPQDYIYLDINPVFAGIMGVSRDQIIGKRLKELLPDVSSDWLNIFKWVALTGTPTRSEFYSKSLRRYFKAIAYRPAEGQFAALVEDITERKLAEEALHESEERFRRLADATWEGIIIHKEGIIVDVNESALKMLGYPAEEVIGKSIIDFLAPESIEPALQKFMEGTTHDQLYLEVNGLRKDNTVFSAEVLGRPIRYQNLDARVIAIRDITKRKALEMELVVYREELEELVKKRTAELEELNKTLKVMVHQREADKKELQEKILSDVNELIIPYLEKIKIGLLNATQEAYMDIVETNLKAILIDPFLSHMSAYHLTPTERQIAELIKAGRSTTEIASIFKISPQGVSFHRGNIRKKLGLGRENNLESVLLQKL